MLDPLHATNDIDSACKELLQQAYKAFNTRDVEAALLCMDSDVDWPNGMEGGYVYGHKGVHDYWVRQWHMIDPHVEPVSFSNGDDGSIIVEVHQVVRDLEGNIILEETVYHAYMVMQGLIKRMEIRKATPLVETVEGNALLASSDH